MIERFDQGEFMIDQAEVDRWLADFVKRLCRSFGERLIFVGHQGSWARGEPRHGSDIDVAVIIDHIDSQDLTAFRNMVGEMPNAKPLASGVFLSISELKASRRSELVQFFYGCKILYGTLNGIIGMPESADLREHIQVTASASLFHARHYILYPHDWGKVVHKLYYPFKECFYALQSWILLREGKFIPTKDELFEQLSEADDKEVIRIAKNWQELEQDREKQPLYYIELLERWSRNMLSRLQNCESNGERKTR